MKQQVILKREYPPHSRLEKTLQALLYVAAAVYWLHEKWTVADDVRRRR